METTLILQYLLGLFEFCLPLRFAIVYEKNALNFFTNPVNPLNKMKH